MAPYISGTSIIIAITAIGLSLTGAFNVYVPTRITETLQTFHQQHHDATIRTNKASPLSWTRDFQKQRQNTVLYSWLRDALNDLGFNFFQEKRKFGNQLEDESTSKSLKGIVIRTATRKYDSNHSKPSSSLYTTKKDTQAQITVRPEGVEGDYNHYRTTALSSTPDRAVSILTTDVIDLLKKTGYDKIQVGDLGENIYIDGIDYKFFEVGKRYKFSNSKSKSAESEKGVIIEITERIEPCGNLCKLTFINDENIPPNLRFENCKKFLLWLDQKDGLRGWYAKIIGDGGRVQLGDEIMALAMD